MKTRFILLISILAVLLSGSVPQAKAGEPPGASPVVPGVMSGGDYRLAQLAWEVGTVSSDMVSSGGGYRLRLPASPATGNNCCCSYLPCVYKH